VGYRWGYLGSPNLEKVTESKNCGLHLVVCISIEVPLRSGRFGGQLSLGVDLEGWGGSLKTILQRFGRGSDVI
jgi:hypothetical protein